VKDKAGGLSLTAEELGADAAAPGGGAGMEGTGVWLVLGLVPGLASDDEPPPPQADKSPGSDIANATNHHLKERSPMDITCAGSFGRSSKSEFHVGSMTARGSPCVAQGRFGVSHE
jgi:hypothetical protein